MKVEAERPLGTDTTAAHDGASVDRGDADETSTIRGSIRDKPSGFSGVDADLASLTAE